MGLFDLFRKKKLPSPEILAGSQIIVAQRYANDFISIKGKNNFPKQVTTCYFHRAILSLHYASAKTFIFNETREYQDKFSEAFHRLNNQESYEYDIDASYCEYFDKHVGILFKEKGSNFDPVAQSILAQLFVKSCLNQSLPLSYSQQFARDNFSITTYGAKISINTSETLTKLMR